MSYIGCAISLACLLLSLLIFIMFGLVYITICNNIKYLLDLTKLLMYFYCRRALNKGILLYIHINFVISLSLALTVFVVGIESATGYNVSDMFLHYILVYNNNNI